MTKLSFSTFFLLAITAFSYGQKKKSETPLTPPRGYYLDLQKFSAEPLNANDLDKQSFPYDAAVAERRLSIKPYYLEGVNAEEFEIPDPPANSSRQTRAELNYLLTLQQQRTQLDVESSMYMAGVFYNLRTKPEDSTYNFYRNNLFHVGRTIGTWFNPQNLPLTADLMARVWRDASFFIWSLKYKYLRVRPYVLEPALANLEQTDWPAYPSGHAANSFINAYIYQELAPEFTDVFLKDAYDMAHSREIIGVHYPSDSEASRVLARQFVNKLFQSEKFRNDFELVKKEWSENAFERFEKPSTSPAGFKKGAACGSKPVTECAKTSQ
ncbi:MAG TPA: phosphatase [Chryseosolibacter sp.]|nr:phosphatase [Chryseosolibacter sp.]